METATAPDRRPYILYDARDMTIGWPPANLSRKEASTQNHMLALAGRPEIWILRDAFTLYLMTNGVRTAQVN